MIGRLVSVVIPTFNFRKAVLKSIQSVIDQTYKNIEIVVVNDSPFDSIGNEIKNKFPRVIYFHDGINRGGGMARNIGIDIASGDFVAFLDDDLYFDFKIMYLMDMARKNPFLLIHEGEADKLLANEIASQVNFELQILEPLDPLKIKWVIGQSKIIVSSRFYGLVSALSQGVPVLATGWSHKYQCLLEDYNVNDALIDVVNGRVEAEKHLGLLLSDSHEYIRISNIIRQCGVRQKETVELMWDRLSRLLMLIYLSQWINEL
jgi:glycosyltransferase involved in cell wall biosynthesis